MQEPKLFMLLPEQLVCTPDGMEVHPETGDLMANCVGEGYPSPRASQLSVRLCR
ncbi:hypothetical protein ACH6CV_14285 [Bacillota bacterium Meth-B3]|nr:hypothetical protein [Christensenellaceae bacterium]MEA5064837.1 hypothetical protein [Eubacteriales bacterium]